MLIRSAAACGHMTDTLFCMQRVCLGPLCVSAAGPSGRRLHKRKFQCRHSECRACMAENKKRARLSGASSSSVVAAPASEVSSTGAPADSGLDVLALAALTDSKSAASASANSLQSARRTWRPAAAAALAAALRAAALLNTVEAGDEQDYASGVFVSSCGLLLTVAHFGNAAIVSRDGVAVRDARGSLMHAALVVSDHSRDLALLRLSAVHQPVLYARLSESPPQPGDTIHGVGQHQEHYDVLHEMRGQVLAVHDTRIVHSIETYDGYSGSPLLDLNGRLIGLHRSRDLHGSYGVSLSEIRKFISQLPLPYQQRIGR